jgi:hypothetical protein
MLLAEASDGKSPLVQPIAALPQRFLERLIGPRDEAVERHRDVDREHAIEPPGRVCS